jgi:3-dehydroquinate synthase
MTDTASHVQVDLGERSYGIYIGEGLLSRAGALMGGRLHAGQRVMVVTDSRVGPLYLDELEISLQEAGCRVASCVVPEGEASKCVEQLSRIWSAAVDARLDRSSMIIALGGGVVGDLAGFAAASFLRGIDFIQIPTSLLAMVDSSVGGKTGINLPQGKNLVGAFHQPSMVIADLKLLSTLSPREFSSGLAEVVKYGVIHDAGLFAMLEQEASRIRKLEMQPLTDLVTRSCEIKAEIVRQDEREGGVRAFLNFGHTLGHAIENVSGYGVHLHGEAIAAGMVYAARVSEQQCGFSPTDTARLVGLLQAFDLSTTFEGASWDELFQVMTADKKAQNAIPRFVLCDKLGKANLPVEVPVEILKKVFGTWSGQQV